MREQGLTYSQIGEIYGVNKSIPWKMLNKNIPEMKVGNKTRINTRPIFKVWEYVPDVHEIIETIALRHTAEVRENLKDSLLRWVYSRQDYFKDKFEAIPEEHHKRFLAGCLNRVATHVVYTLQSSRFFLVGDFNYFDYGKMAKVEK